jgi:oligopeptide/dipeptide ABC transporter ATP-binding protein
MGEAFARAMNPQLWTQQTDKTRSKTKIKPHDIPASAETINAMTNKLPLLHVRGLTVRFPVENGMIAPVNNLSFDVFSGEIVGIVGESGSGKSMTALSLAQIVPYPGKLSAEKIELNGNDLLNTPEQQVQRILGNELAMIFQDPMSSLNPALSIETQVTEAPRIHRALSRAKAHDLAVQRMNDVHIPAAKARLKQYPHEFSGGMRQRAMIAMGLMNQPALIIADEPTTALDVTIQAQILDVLKEINREFGTAIILISHDIGVILDICERVLVMYGGRIVEDIPAADLLSTVKHPYTEALIATVPDIHANRDEPLASIKGTPPDLNNLPKGCVFAPRCPYVESRCKEESPPLMEAKPGHRLACFVVHDRLQAQAEATS